MQMCLLLSVGLAQGPLAPASATGCLAIASSLLFLIRSTLVLRCTSVQHSCALAGLARLARSFVVPEFSVFGAVPKPHPVQHSLHRRFQR